MRSRSFFRAVPWSGKNAPRKILVLRFQATGDVVITLPWIQSLKDQLPATEIHFVTRTETSPIPRELSMFTKVIAIGGGRNARLQFLLTLLWLPYFFWQRYDVVLDLQNHRISRMIRRVLGAKSWSEFDRSSAVLAGDRTREAINALRLPPVSIAAEIKLKNPAAKFSGIAPSDSYVILNPAGAFETRHWPVEHYLDFATLWLTKYPETKIVVLGLPSKREVIPALKTHLGSRLINLIGETTPFEAFCLVRNAQLVLSEDSGLMHMAWTQRVPTVAIFGSTRSDWSAPMGEWSYCFNSSDLPCGNCMLEHCAYNDNHCLTRRTAAEVFAKASELLAIYGGTLR